MTATAEPSASTVQATTHPPLARGEGVELLGPVHGSGYRDGAALVRRADGQMVQLGPLMYTLLESADGERDTSSLAAAMSERIGRRLGEEQGVQLAKKLAAQGLLAGFEQHAPPKRNPLLALRWKVLVTDPVLTRRLTAPFTFLFRPWRVWPDPVGVVGGEAPGPRSGPHPAANRAVHVPVPAVADVARPGRFRRGVLVRPVPQGRGGRYRAGLPQPRVARTGIRARGRLGRIPRARTRLRVSLRRGNAGGHGHGPIPGLAGLLHRRHRLLPAAPPRPAAGGPRRALLQRGRRGGHDGRLARVA